MAKKKRRKSKKNKGNLTLAIMLGVIFIIIGIFVFKAINKNDTEVNTSTTEATENGDYQYNDDSVDVSPDNSEDSDEETDESTLEDSSTTTTEATTEPLTLPINNEPEDMVDVILSYYTDLMGFPDGALFIRDSETDETASGYTYTLRLNAKGSPNELIGDVYVEKGTGKVTDSMGNDPWNIED